MQFYMKNEVGQIKSNIPCYKQFNSFVFMNTNALLAKLAFSVETFW